MSPPKPRHEERTHAPAWSPETETREDVKALLRRRSALMPGEILVFRRLYTEMYDTYFDTLACVVRSRGAKGAVVTESGARRARRVLGRDRRGGVPGAHPGEAPSLASGAAQNHVRRKGRDPATQEMPTSSKETARQLPRSPRGRCF